MKRQSWLNILVVALLAWVLAAWPAAASLTATVTPGYQLAPGEVPTAQTLNLLGEPIVEITGTVDGSTGLTPGSVNGALLADSVPDGLTLDFNAQSPRQLEIKQQGVSSNQIAVSLMGAGLWGGNGIPMYVYADPTYFMLATYSIGSGSTSATNGWQQEPWLTLAPLSLTDTNVSKTANIQVTKLQPLGTNGVLVSTPGATNTPAALSPEFAVVPTAPALATNGQPWMLQYQQIVTNLNLGTNGNYWAFRHGYGAVPTYVQGFLSIYGTNVITTNVVVGVSTNYTTNAPNITGQFVPATFGGGGIPWQYVYPGSVQNGQVTNVNTAAGSVFSWFADTNYVYVSQLAPTAVWPVLPLNSPLAAGLGTTFRAPLNNSNNAVVFWATNFQLQIVIRY